MTFASLFPNFTHSHWNDRLQAKERRKKVTPTVGVGLAEVIAEPTKDDGLFPVGAVRVKPKQDDELSQRIKGLFPNSLTPRAPPAQDRSHHPTHHPHPGGTMAPQKTDIHGRPPNHIAPPPNPQQSERSKGKDSKKRSEGSEHKHKHKDKKRKSSHSEEKHSKKKSKSNDKSPPAKESRESRESRESATARVSQPKKISNRSSSVSSDVSDHSVKSRSSTDKQFASSSSNRHSGHGTNSDHTTSQPHSKSKPSSKYSSSSSQYPPHNSTSTSTTSTQNSIHSSLGASNSSKGAANSHVSKTAVANDDMGLHSAAETLFGSGSHNHSSSGSSGSKGSTTAANNSSAKTDSRPMNGLVRLGTKPTNLVIPSINPSQHPQKGVKGDVAVKEILDEMMKPTKEKITEIQTPCKADLGSQYTFSSLASLPGLPSLASLPKAIEPIKPLKSHPSANKPINKPGSKYSDNAATKEREKAANRAAAGKIIPVKHTNGVTGDLKASEIAASDSDSGSSSGSSSSDSSNTGESSSDSDSSDDEEPKTSTTAPSMMFPKMERSPAPSTVHEENNDKWNLDNYLEKAPPPVTDPSDKPTVSKLPAPSTIAGISPANTQMINSDTPPKKKRGRPRKGEIKNPDPDFTLPEGSKLPLKVNSIVVTDRKKRNPSSSSLSKAKSNDSKDTKKRGRPPIKKASPAAGGKPVLASLKLASAEYSISKVTEDLTPSPPRSASSTGPGSRPLDNLSSGADDEDVDVDVVSDESPDSSRTPIFQVVKPPSSPVKVKTEPGVEEPRIERDFPEEFPKHEPIKIERDFPKHEPISPPQTKPLIHSQTVGEVKILPISIPFYRLSRRPVPLLNRPVKLEPSTSSPMDIPALPVIKSEKLPPPLLKRKQASPSSQFQAILDAKKRKVKDDNVIIKIDQAEPVKSRSLGHQSGSKDIGRSTNIATVPTYEGSSAAAHQRARDLKNQWTNTTQKPLKHLLILESVVTFMMSGIAKEAEDPKGVNGVRSYYTSTLNLAENNFGDCLKEASSSSTHRSIHKCCQVLCHYVLAHLKYKCYKLLKDLAQQSSKRIEEQLKDKRSAISPHNHPALPGSSPAVPSPASIASTGSITSDSGRSNSLPPVSVPSVTLPESMLKDVGDYQRCMNYLSSSVDTYKTAHVMRDHLERKEFFAQLTSDLAYNIEILTESRQFVHYIHTGCVRLKSELDIASLAYS